MTGSSRRLLAGAVALLTFGTSGAIGQVATPSFSLSPELQAKVDRQPNVRKVTDWGSRADWSADSKRLLFVSREYGDVFELDVATGKTRPMSFHFSHDGIFRAYYLADGNLLLSAQRDHTPGANQYGRFFGSELWLMKGDLSGPAVPLGERNLEGVAVSRTGMRIVWARPQGAVPPVKGDADLMRGGSAYSLTSQLWTGHVKDGPGGAAIVDKQMVLDCNAPNGPLAAFAARAGLKCMLLEPQNFVPGSDARITFSVVWLNARDKRSEVTAHVMDMKTGKVSQIGDSPSYAEVEGVFPDGKSTLVEYAREPDIAKATSIIDLWQFPLDGKGAPRPVTRYNSLDARLKSNQGVISPDGRWMAFGISTDEIEKKVAGQGTGIFLMDLKAAGF